jgi:hypothetical protein
MLLVSTMIVDTIGAKPRGAAGALSRPEKVSKLFADGRRLTNHPVSIDCDRPLRNVLSFKHPQCDKPKGNHAGDSRHYIDYNGRVRPRRESQKLQASKQFVRGDPAKETLAK